MVERKAFLANQSINIMHHNEENMIVVPISKRIEIIMCIQVCLTSRMNIDYKENGGKAFLASQSINIMHHNKENMIVVRIVNGMQIIMSVQGCLFSWMTFDYKEIGGKKAFPANLMHQYCVS